MTRAEFVSILEPLAQAMRADMDAPTLGAYYRAFEYVPPALLSRVVDRLIREPLQFFPKAGELRAECEKQRRAVLALHPYEGCQDCEHSKGWRTVLEPGKQASVQRCPCQAKHRAFLAGLGASEPLAALPGEVEGDNEQVYPTVEELPAPLRKQLLEQVRQRVIR